MFIWIEDGMKQGSCEIISLSRSKSRPAELIGKGAGVENFRQFWCENIRGQFYGCKHLGTVILI